MLVGCTACVYLNVPVHALHVSILWRAQAQAGEVVQALDNEGFFKFLRTQMDKSDQGGTFTPMTPTKAETGDKKKQQAHVHTRACHSAKT